jgi:hypothetical protein
MTKHYDRVSATIESGSTDELLEEAWAWAEHSCPATGVALGAISLTTTEGVVFDAHAEGHAIGWKITDSETGRVEYLMLAPSGGHQINPDNGAIADTFLYLTTGEVGPGDSVVDSGEPLTYVNHLHAAQPPTSTPQRPPLSHRITAALESYEGTIETYAQLPEAEQIGRNYEDYEDSLLDLAHLFADLLKETTKHD